MPDGTIPTDNPFTTEGGNPAVWSYGHRNVQGLVYHAASGQLIAHEHGPKGGDELNVIEPGKNYGWPTITYGINYDGTIITDETEAEGMEQPAVKWVPSIAPSGMTVVQTAGFEDWTGDLLIGAMDGPAGQKLVRVDIGEDGSIGETEDLLNDMQTGFRDVISTPDAIYVATNLLDGVVYRVEKAS
jgi:glucose/arabinose dehydrogenase